MSDAAPLAGRVVLLLRPKGMGAKLAERLEALGARTLHAPVLAFAPPDDDAPAQAAIAAIARYDLLVFTSAAGVRAFTERTSGTLRGLRAAAVGPATSAALLAAGIAPVLVATEGHLDGLCAELPTLDPPARTILAVRPQGKDSGSFDTLRQRGMEVDEVAFYRTVAGEGVPSAVAALASGSVDAVVFTSPSTLRVLLEAPGSDCTDALRSIRRIAIGPVTAAACAAAGLCAHAVAREPAPESVCDAVREALRSPGSV